VSDPKSAPSPALWSWEFHPDNGHPVALVSDAGHDVILATGESGDGEHVWMQIGESDRAVIQTASELLTALRDLVAANEDWNAAVALIIGKPPGWTDEYLDRARAAIKKALPIPEPEPPKCARCGNAIRTSAAPHAAVLGAVPEARRWLHGDCALIELSEENERLREQLRLHQTPTGRPQDPAAKGA
jgi:hypothetical protein